MRRRFRVAAGIVTLTAMILSLAEGVRASVCLPGTFDTGDVATTAEGDGAHEDCMSAGGNDRSSDSEGGPTSSPQNCPLSPLGVTGSCAAAPSLPTGVLLAAGSPAPEHVFDASSPDRAHPRIATTDLFHPPKA